MKTHDPLSWAFLGDHGVENDERCAEDRYNIPPPLKNEYKYNKLTSER
jgi:hypothetical protein